MHCSVCILGPLWSGHWSLDTAARKTTNLSWRFPRLTSPRLALRRLNISPRLVSAHCKGSHIPGPPQLSGTVSCLHEKCAAMTSSSQAWPSVPAGAHSLNWISPRLPVLTLSELRVGLSQYDAITRGTQLSCNWRISLLIVMQIYNINSSADILHESSSKPHHNSPSPY